MSLEAFPYPQKIVTQLLELVQNQCLREISCQVHLDNMMKQVARDRIKTNKDSITPRYLILCCR